MKHLSILMWIYLENNQNHFIGLGNSYFTIFERQLRFKNFLEKVYILKTPALFELIQTKS